MTASSLEFFTADPAILAHPIAAQLMLTLYNDRPKLRFLDRYFRGEQDDPYLPSSEDPELKKLMERSKLNLIDHAVETSAEKLFVDSVRPGRTTDEDADLPEWEHWQVSRLDSRQVSLYESAFKFGHGFTRTKLRGGKVQTGVLSPLATSALFADPANDETPYAALTVTSWPTVNRVGIAEMYDDVNEYEVWFSNLGDTTDITVLTVGPHGATACPVTRFAAHIDSEGRTLGIVEPLVILQDRINQSIYNLMVVQTSAAYKIKTIAGMSPPLKMQRVLDGDGMSHLEPILDADGNPQVDKLKINPAMVLWAEDKDTKFGTLDATPLDGFLATVRDFIRQFTSKSRVPPHFMAGEIANVSADALQALSEALENRVSGFKATFGESWERVFRLAAELNGIPGAIDDYKIEVVWRDTSSKSLAALADGVSKLALAGFPIEGLFDFIPGMTHTMKAQWLDLLQEQRDREAEAAEKANAAKALTNSIKAASATTVSRSAKATPATPAKADKVP